MKIVFCRNSITKEAPPDKCQKVVDYIVYLRHNCYLLYKLSKESKENMNNYPIMLFIPHSIYPFVQEMNSKTLSKKETQRKDAKVNSQWRVEGKFRAS